MKNGVPFTITCPEAKVVSFNQGKTNDGVSFMVFTIKCSLGNMLLQCTVFDDEENHELYKKARLIKKGAYYIVFGELKQRKRDNNDIEPIVKVTELHFCHDEIAINSQPITNVSGFGR